MAVTFKGGHQDFLTHLCVGPEYLNALAVLHGKLTFVSDNFKLTSSKFGLTGKLSHSTSSLLKMDKSGPSVTQARLQIEAAIVKFVQTVDPSGLKVKVKSPFNIPAHVNIPAMPKPPLGPNPFAQKPVPPAMLGVEKLADAGKMYQPVRGTSQGSVYATVALSDTMKVAVRVGDEKLSIRVEGSCVNNPAMVKKMLDLGLTETKGSHYSMHLSCGAVPVERVIGAVLAGLGVEFLTPVPVLARVKEAAK